MKTFIIFLYSVLICAVIGHAGDGTWVKKTPLVTLYTGQYTLFEPQRVSSEDTRAYNKMRGFVRLNYSRKMQSDRTHGYDWNLTVNFTYLVNGVSTPGSVMIRNEASGRIYEDYQEIPLPDAALGYAITVTSIIANYGGLNTGANTAVSPPQTSAFIPDDIDLILELRTERVYNLNTTPVLDDISRISFTPADFKMYWDYQEGAEEYDLEWVFIDKYSPEYTQVVANEPASLTELVGYKLPFELLEPTRVRVWGNSYQLDKAYPEGILYFRVRAVSTFADQTTGISDDIRTGKWGYLIHSTNLALCKYEITDLLEFQSSKTWLYGVSYADDGKSVSTLTYFDGSNRGRQNLTYNTSDNMTLVGESKYDNEGRQTVSVIPAPVAGRNLLYQNNFNLGNDGSVFDEEEIEQSAILPLKNTSGSAKYFSVNNDFTNDLFRGAIPDAQGYVFSQTIFRNDGTGRIERVGGIGEDFQAMETHAVRTWYGSTNVAELKRLFGDNVSDNPQGYRKDMVQDANGQLSVTYYDKRGNTIVSTLAGDAPSSLRKLDYTAELITTPLNDNNVKIGNAIISEHTHLNTVAGSEIKLSYNLQSITQPISSQILTIEGHELSLGDFCPDCKYNLRIEVLRPDGTPVPSPAPLDIPIGPATPCAAPNYSVMDYTVPLAEIGEYRIIKTLTVNEESMIAAFQAQLDAQGTSSFDSFLQDYLTTVDITACLTDCEELCMNSVKVDYIQQHGIAAWMGLTKDAITFLIDQCVLSQCGIDDHLTGDDSPILVNSDDACETQRQRMLHQISPGGILYDDHNSSFWLAMGSGPITINGTSYTITQLQTPSVYTNEIAKALLIFHREFCMIPESTVPPNTRCKEWMDVQNASLSITNLVMNEAWPSSATGVFATPYSSDPAANAFGMNILLTAIVDGYATNNPITVPTDACATTLSGPTTTLNSGNLYDYVDFFGNYMAAQQQCSGTTLTAEEIKTLKKRLFVSMYLKIKWDLVRYYLGNTGCPLPNDENAVYYIPLDYTDMETIAHNAFSDLFDNVDCKQLAITNVNNWMATLSDDCLATLGATGFTPIVYSTTPGSPAATMQNVYVANSGSTIAQLFYNYSMATCDVTSNSNSTGLFYDPGTGNPGKNWYDAIHTALSTTGCDYYTGTSPTQPSFQSTAPSGSVGFSYYETDELLAAIKDLVDEALSYTGPPGIYDYSTPNGTRRRRTVVLNNVSLVNGYTGNIRYVMEWYLGGSSSQKYDHHLDFNLTNGTCTFTVPLNPAYPNWGPIYFRTKGIASGLPNVSGLNIQLDYPNLRVITNYTAFGQFGDAYDYVRKYQPLTTNCAGTGGSITFGVGSSSQTILDGIAGQQQDDCIQSQIDQATADAQVLYNQVIEDLWSQFYEKMKNCLNVTEDLKMTYTLKEYQYTLYYYDLAGNLVQTVPPQGVHPFNQSQVDNCLLANNTPSFPAHDMETRYMYNGLNALIASYTPDGGRTDLYLDKLYRVRFSQNAQQLANSKASYSKYDELGRVFEAGEFRKQPTEDLAQKVDIVTFPFERIMDYTHTFYEEGYYPPTSSTQAYPASTGYDAVLAAQFGTNGQQNLRNAIGAVMHRQGDYRVDASGTPYLDGNGALILDGTNVLTVISYSYDPHKNVKQVVSSNYQLASIGMQHKKTEYQYDLISGNVEEVKYQRGFSDEYRHRYHYDANNRLVRSFTSHNGDFWELDAKYFYYLHGSLARRELGHDQVQGTDYAYNLQGWLKGVNSTTLDRTRDIGTDGNTGSDNRFFGEDAFGFSLGYFSNDYQAIRDVAESPQNILNDYFAETSTVTALNVNADPGGGSMTSLYNGNITHMVTALRNTDEEKLDILANNYQYDQLQRIREMKVYFAANLQTNNDFTGASLYRSSAGPGTESAFQENYTFDKNGNLLTLKRNGSGVLADGITAATTLAMDDFTYNYYDHSGAVLAPPSTKNQLAYVRDVVTTHPYSGDIASGQSSTNYRYNANGQLISDAQEGIGTIEWTVTGKVRKIDYLSDATHDLKYVYDPMDRRIAKLEYMNSYHTVVKWTYYSYDAGGNVMATYERTRTLTGTSGSVNNYTDVYKISDHFIYGAQRLGTEVENVTLFDEKFTQPTTESTDVEIARGWTLVTPPRGVTAPDYTKRVVGDKRYELANHLGNVLEVITDRKLAPSSLPMAAPTLTGLAGVSVSSGVITRTVAGTGWGTSGGASVETLVQGDQVEWTLGGTSGIDNRYILVGLSYTNTDNGPYSIKFGWYTNGAGLTVVESGAPPAGQTYGYYGPYVPGDVLKIARDNGLILYYHNGNLKYSRTDPQPNSTMVVDFAFYEYNRSIYGLKIVKNSTVSMYTADVVSYSDYSPYGTLLDSRHGNDNTYRYGFQGQERDDEIKGAGNSYNYEYRMHDPRIGRFFAIDQLSAKYPYYSPYAFSGNRVIDAVELEGLEPALLSGFYNSLKYNWVSVYMSLYKKTSAFKENSSTKAYGQKNVTLTKDMVLDAAKDATDGLFWFENMGYVWAGRNLNHYLLGFGGVDIYGYDEIKDVKSFEVSKNDINESVSQDFIEKTKNLKKGETLTIPISQYGSYDDNRETDAALAFGATQMLAEGEINVKKNNKGKLEVWGSLNYTFYDTYDWGPERRGGGLKQLMGIADHWQMNDLKNVGAKDFYSRAYVSAKIWMGKDGFLKFGAYKDAIDTKGFAEPVDKTFAIPQGTQVIYDGRRKI